MSQPSGNLVMGRARYRPIDDRARYWANLFLDEVWKVELRKFSEKKKRVLSGLEPMLILLTDQCNYN